MRKRESRTNYLPYFPNGERALDGAEVLKSSQTEFSTEPFEGASRYEEKVYFEDIQAYIEAYDDAVEVTDVANALKPGHKCQTRLLQRWSDCPDSASMQEVLWGNGVKTMYDLYRFIMEPADLLNGLWDLRIDGFFPGLNRYPSIYTYTPFATIKPIKVPIKWTKRELFEAILSKQIYGASLPESCKDLYSDEYGLIRWATNAFKERLYPPHHIDGHVHEDGTGLIVWNDYDFDRMFSFYFACDQEEAARRRVECPEVEYNSISLSEMMRGFFQSLEQYKKTKC